MKVILNLGYHGKGTEFKFVANFVLETGFHIVKTGLEFLGKQRIVKRSCKSLSRVLKNLFRYKIRVNTH